MQDAGHSGQAFGPVTSVPQSLDDVLAAAQRRTRAAAVVLIAPSYRALVHRGVDTEAEQFAADVVRRAASRLLDALGNRLLSGNEHELVPIVKNRIRDAPGKPHSCKLMALPVVSPDGRCVGLLAAVNRADEPDFGDHDVRRLERFARILSRNLAADHDAMTGLLSRSAFEMQAQMILYGAGDDAHACILYGDIDQLHVVNDLWGFGVGDEVITCVGKQLNALLKDHQALASRLSGDRFTVLLPDCTLARGQQLADQLLQAMHRNGLPHGRHVIPVSMSWGVAPVDGREPSLGHALAAAEIACKAAKDRGRNRVEVYQDADQSIIRRHNDILILGRVRDALDTGRFRVEAQPIVQLAGSGPIERYELLVRMIDELGNPVAPGVFFSAATRYQLLPDIDRWVLNYVLNRMRDARPQLEKHPKRFSINLSGPTLSDPGLLEWLLTRITENDIPGEWLGFEVTETAAIANIGLTQMLMRRLSARGCRFALDDFGTGLSSLAYLKSLDVATVKLDGSFVRDLLENPRSESLVRAVTQLATSMGIETVAEYVETPAIHARLIELGVQYGQGFALGRPMSFEHALGLEAGLAESA
jgi:diguanylate cyclase (GGDEF)-like protein